LASGLRSAPNMTETRVCSVGLCRFRHVVREWRLCRKYYRYSDIENSYGKGT